MKLLFRVVEVQRTCEATATPSIWTEGANLSELLSAACKIAVVRTIRGFDYRETNHFRLFNRVSGIFLGGSTNGKTIIYFRISNRGAS